EAAVLRFQRGLQVGGIVNRVRPRIAREQFEGMTEALLQVDGQAVINRVAIGELCVDAVEGHGHTEAGWIPGERSQRYLSRVASRQHARNGSDEPCEGRIRSRRSEEIEERRRADVLAVEWREWCWTAEELAEHRGSYDANAACRCGGQNITR